MNEVIHHSFCPLCGGSHLEYHLTAADHLVTQQQFDIIRCADCKFMFTQDAPTFQSIGTYYESPRYQPHYEDGGIMGHVYALARAMMLRRKANLIHRYVEQAGALLDIGAGRGHFMSQMRRRGWSVTGCEQSRSARQYASSNFGLSLAGNVMEADFDDGSFDVITLWHSMEHIHDLNGLWQLLSRWLAEEGLLLLALPNAESADSRYYGSDWAAWDVPRHLWHLSPESLSSLACRHNFRVIGMYRLPLDVFYISLLSERNRFERFGPFKAMFRSMLFSMRSLVQQGHSSSLIYLLKKLK